MSSFLPRTIEKIIGPCKQHFKVILLSGMHKVGKSSCSQHTAPSGLPCLNLDDSFLLNEALTDTGNFFTRHPVPLLIENIQRTPKLLLQAKAEVDKTEKAGQLFLTSTQKFSLMLGLPDSLAGRLLPLELWPLSIYERFGKGLEQTPYVPCPGVNSSLPPLSSFETWKLIWQGAFPRVISLFPIRREHFFSDWLSAFLEKEIRGEFGIEKIPEFLNFLRILASRVGRELRIGAIAKEAEVSEPTIRKWLKAAETTGVIFLLRPYRADIKRQLVKSSKLCFTDTGLASYLIGLFSPEALVEYKDSEKIFENFVVSEIFKSYLHNGLIPQIFFYRDSKTRQEIPLLIRKDNALYPVEIKTSSHPTKDVLKDWSVLEDLPETIGSGSVICLTEKPYRLDENCIAHSVWNI